MARQFPNSIGTHPQPPLYPSGSGPGGVLGGSGTIGRIPLWTGGTTLGDSSMAEHDGAVWFDGNVEVAGFADAGDFVLTGGSPGEGGGGTLLLSILDEGVLQTSSVRSINFVGAGVTATAVGDVVQVSITFDQAAADARYALLAHTHPASDISGLAGAVQTIGDARWLKLTGGTLSGALHGTTADFTGEVDADDFVLVGGSGGGGASAALFSVLDEGVLKSSAVSSINFVGAGVAASAVGDAVTVTISFDQAAADARYSQLGHTHTFASLTSKPTTIGGFGITDFNSLGDARWLSLGGGTMTGPITMQGTGGAYFVKDRITPAQVFAFYANADYGILWTGNGIDALKIAYVSGVVETASAIRSKDAYGFTVGNISGVQRILWQSEQTNFFTFVTAANGYAGIEAGGLLLPSGFDVQLLGNGTGIVNSVGNRVMGFYSDNSVRANYNLYVSGALLLSGHRLYMERSGGPAGINWYDSTYNAWQTYMAPPGAGQGIGGALTAPSGTLVTSWALRSLVEGAGGYGWTWESGTNTGTTPSIAMELSSATGNLRNIGTHTAADFILS